jgi:hypothetical protein
VNILPKSKIIFKITQNYSGVITNPYSIMHRVSSNAEISFKGVTAKTPSHKAELFNMYFPSVFTPSQPNTHLADANNSIPLRTDQTLSDHSDVTIKVNKILECLNGLDKSKAYGPDGIPSRLLKECHQ